MIPLLNATTELPKDAETLQKLEETLEEPICYHSPVKGWFASSQGNRSTTTYVRAMGEKAGAGTGQIIATLASENTPRSASLTVTPLLSPRPLL